MVSLTAVQSAIHARVRETGRSRATLVAITGIDGCGKGFITRALADRLNADHLRVAAITIDGWLNLPHVRFAAVDPARHFYEHAIRFDDMFRDVVLPLTRDRHVHAISDFAEETAADYRPETWRFDAIDVVLLEGIYLLKQAYRQHYDLAVWIECTFETALERAIARQQEGLSREETVRAYETIYFPAQRVHFAIDKPRAAAALCLVNDARLAPGET